MQRLVSALTNQGIWGERNQQVNKEIDNLIKKRDETDANLNRLQGEIEGTINGILDSNPKTKGDAVLKEAQTIVMENVKKNRKTKKPPQPPEKD